MSAFQIEIHENTGASETRVLLARQLRQEKLAHLLTAYIGSRAGFTGDFRVVIRADRWQVDEGDES